MRWVGNNKKSPSLIKRSAKVAGRAKKSNFLEDHEAIQIIQC